MFLRRVPAVLITATLILAAACSRDDAVPEETPGAPAPGDDAAGAAGDRATLEAEYIGIQRRLGPVQNQAMQDPALQAQFESLETAVDEAMVALDAEVPAQRERLTALEVELQTAQAAGDTATAQTILEEGNVLSAQMQRIRAQAFQQEAIVAKMTAFQESVITRMVEIDPEAKALIDRATVIAAQLQPPEPPPGP